MKHILKLTNHFLSETSGWLLIVIMTLSIIDVMGRLFKPLHSITELTIFLLVAVVYFGMSSVEENHGHIRLEILSTKMPKKVRKFLNIFTYVIMIITIFLCLWAVGLGAIDSFISKEKIPGVVPMIIYPSKFAMGIGTFIFLIQIVSNFIDQLY